MTAGCRRLAGPLALVVLGLPGCGGGSSNTAASPPPPPPPPSAVVSVSGIVAYQFVPPNPGCQGLDFGSIDVRPIRGATVQLLNGSSAVIATTVSGNDGRYLFNGIAANSNVRLRVRAELKRQGSPAWDVEVRDNVVDPNDPAPPPLASRPLYVMDSTAFNTGTADVNRNLTATTGWGGSSYTGARVAAPFAILDTIYSTMQFFIAVDPGIQFPPLDAFWSVNNTLVASSDIDAGELSASFYLSNIDSLFLLGDAGADTEEFDDHVIAHEWGHYFEDTFSRSDSIGGAHSIGDRLDARLAFGEGWATALSGMALGNPIYCDTGPPGTAAGFGIGTESGSYNARGWYDEISVVRFIYDLWDDNDEGNDSGSIGFGPIYDTLVGPQRFTEAYTTVFSFASALRSSLPPADQAFLDTQLLREDMTPGFDIWGDGEVNDAGGRDVLPVYTDLVADGSVVNVCANGDFDPLAHGNKLGEFRYLRVAVPATSAFDVSIVTTTTGALPPDDPNDLQDQSDPDIYIYRDGAVVAFGISGIANSESFRSAVLPGPDTYVADVAEYRYLDPGSPAGFPGQMCFDISFTPVP